MKEYTYFR